MNRAFLHASWPAPPGIHALTTLRYGAGISLAPFDTFNLGNSHSAEGDHPGLVAQNRQELITQCGLPAAPHWLRQVHGTTVQRFTASPTPAMAEPEADAAVTSASKVVLAVLTADCLPVVFAAVDGSEIGVAHAGWRGLAAGILEQTIQQMHTPAGQLIAWLGPAAGPLAYEVGAEVRAVFMEHDAHAESAFQPSKAHHWWMNLYTLARQRLITAGLVNEHIYGGEFCTISDSQRFYSHRRDQRSGRMATLIWRTEEN